MKKRIVIAAVLVAIGAGGVASWRAHGAGRPPQAPEAVAAVPVVAAKVAVSDVPIELTGIGTVMAYNLVHVNARVTGTIEQIGIVQGQTVHPGSLIAELDPRPFQAALKEAEANLARDQASLANAEINLNRYIPLLKPGYASAQQVADQESAVSEAKAQVEADKAAIFNAATQLSYTRITSPIDGVTGILGVDIGNIVQAGAATPIVTITQIQPIYVDFTLPQDDLPAVQAAMAKGALSAVAYGQDDRTELGRGTLLLVNNTINQSDGTMQLRATFPNANRALWPGEFVNVRLVIGVRHDGITVPMSAVQQGQSGSFVFVVAPDGTARERPVSVAETIGGRALIDKGLESGDTVVTAGQYGLADGAKVAEVGAGNPRVQDVTEASAGML
ncbi:MAG TPA: efflux RND transporter periplasmic adaptor subunit [Acetobacteraceae bacterium]|nr:efflux RND transporter periplasmic adaptor subunit [Acetobacteraceae bacterium]